MKIWDKSVLYNILHAYANWGTRWSFRRFKVEGRENVPTEGPVILACNHCNSLMDAMVVLRVNRNLTAFGARADIFRNKKIAKVLTFLRIVPLARQRDSIREMKENLHTFDEIVECIGRGVNFTIYVEGTHRAERGMMPVKRGIFRICDIAREKLGEEVTIVPVGLAYEEFFEYMKDITVRYGKPFKLSELPEGPKAEQLQQKILELICDYPVNRRDPLWVRIPLSLLSLPLFAAAGLLCFPVLIAEAAIGGRLKDKAWLNTVKLVCKILILPLLVIAWGVAAFILLPWWGALLLLAGLLWSHSLWHLLLNYYKPIFSK